ncbi:hypothetical protein NQ317_006653, partial [Molorchus minor]
SICTTNECLSTAYFLRNLMEPNTDPCDNFYNFTCGNYKGDLVLRNLQQSVDQRVKSLIDGPMQKEDSRSVKLQKRYYQACMNLTNIEEDQNETLKKLFEQLGNWPVLEGPEWNESRFNWGSTVEKCKDLGLYYDWFVNIYAPGYENKLSIDVPDNVNNIDSSTRQHYTELIMSVVKLLGSPKKLTNISKSVNEIIDFELELAKLYICYRIQANYIFWKVTESFSAFLTQSIRKKFEAYSDNLEEYEYPKDREEYCYGLTSTVFAYVSESEFVRQFITERNAVKAMVERIKFVLYNHIGRAKWMSQSDKSLAYFKLKNVRVVIGGPDEMYDKYGFDNFLGIDQNDGSMTLFQISLFHLDNTIDIIREVDRSRDLYNLDFVKPRLTVDQAKFYQATVHLALIKYLPDENVMFLPAATLQGHLFSLNRPNYLNYGALGSVIGHELAHGFGLLGNVVVENGEEKVLWTNFTHDNFLIVSQCLLHNCNNIGIENNIRMNCNRTFEESFADYIGINLAYEAYIQLEQERGDEKKLPGFPYSPTQFFWITYTSIMCNNLVVNNTESFTHMLPFHRIVGAFRNSEYFAQDFKCPVGTNMNPVEKCFIL